MAATSSRDTQRLKSHLSGKKRARGDDDEAAKQISDNEEDSRGASVKKKMRIDPFEASSKKKKKEAKVSPPPRSTPPPPKEKPEVNKKPSIEQALSGDVSPPEPSSPPLSSSKKKKKKHKNKNQTPTDSEPLLGPNKVPYGLASSNVNGASIAKSPESTSSLRANSKCLFMPSTQLHPLPRFSTFRSSPRSHSPPRYLLPVDYRTALSSRARF